MKIDRQALIFGGIIVAITILVAGMVWLSSLFKAPSEGAQTPIENFFSALFPFGSGTRTDTGGTGTIGGEDTPSGPVPRLRKVSDAPVAGFRFKEDGVLRYGERETGHFFETAPDAFGVVRISNTTIPAVQDIVWLSDTTFVMDYLDEIGSVRHFLAQLASSTPDQFLTGNFIGNATEVLPGTDADSLTLVTKNNSGTLVERASINNVARATLFSSSLRSWNILPSGKEIYIETSPSSVSGSLYRLKNGTLEKIAQGSGFMALPRDDGAYILYSVLENNAPALFIYSTATGEATRLPIATFAEKCAWFPGVDPRLFCAVPDSAVAIENWYMGLSETSDTAWTIDATGGTATIVARLDEEAGRTIDVFKPSVSENGLYGAFIDKSDLSLWSLRFAK